jgi:drug/metabolite transporter (DMT)-like permease
MINTWQFWVIIYLIAGVLFAQKFKSANRNMKNAGSLTILLELFTGVFSLLMIPVFDIKFDINTNVLLILLIVVFIYAITDRLNIEARYGLDPSTFSMLKQLSTVFMIIFGFMFLKEKFVFSKLLGTIFIIGANIILAYNKGKFTINKYFIMSFVANFLFAVAMLINVDLSDHFNLAFYTYITVTIPSILIFIFGRHKIKDIKEEFKLCKKNDFLIAAFSWALMLNASIRAYQLGSVTVVASLFALTAILNALVEFIFSHNKNKFIQKVIAATLIIIGVILVNG